jgi:xanthine dehydrogenase iron-sulfur cluster and FAD-binding subunit A
MKPAPFDYIRPDSLAEVCELLAADEDARLIAGGQTLVPMLAMRLARPAKLIDILRLPELAGIREQAGSIVVGATTRQAQAERDPVIKASVPLLARVLPWVGHPPTRNRGTIGGSIANADPSAEIPLVAVTLGAEIMLATVQGPASVPADDFFIGPMLTAIGQGDCISAVRFPVWPHRRIGVGFFEISARRSDFAFVATAAQVALDDDDCCIDVALGVGGVGRAGCGVGVRRRQRCVDKHGSEQRSARQCRLSAAGCRHALHPCARTSTRQCDRQIDGKPAMKVELRINGVTRSADLEPRKTLLDALRENFLLNGAHAGCEHGVCGACTVLLDGDPVRSCLMFAVQADGYEITTIEGLSPAPGELSVIQDAFCETHGLQCGYCTPGMILAAHALLQHTLDPTREDIVEAISGNLCRCTGYGQIVEAVQFAAERLQKSNAEAR